VKRQTENARRGVRGELAAGARAGLLHADDVEITALGLGSQNAVCGGGRYDGLVELLGGPPTKGIGFAIGEDRLFCRCRKLAKAARRRGATFCGVDGEESASHGDRNGAEVARGRVSRESYRRWNRNSKALGQADKLGARYAIDFGRRNEVATGQWTVKTLADGFANEDERGGILGNVAEGL